MLSEDEARGGHTLREPVGKADAEMMGRVLASNKDGLGREARLQTGWFVRIVETANDFVNRTLEQNSSEVDDVATGRKDNAFTTSRFGYRTGREAYTAGRLEPYLRTTDGVGNFFLHDPGSPRGYRIHTAYPRNDGD